MKKLMRTFALMAVAALGLSACTGEKLVPDNGNGDGKFVTVHFGAEAAIEGATKATLTTADELTFKSEWENGDALSVKYSFDYGATKETTATWSADKSCFEAQMEGGNGIWIYDALYPTPNAEGAVDFGSARTQKGNAYNSKYDLMKGSATAEGADAGMTAAGKKIVFEMTRQTAIAYFHFTSTLDEEVVSAKLSVEGATAYLSTSEVKANEDYAKGYAFTKTEGVASKEINLTFDAGAAPTTSDFKLWFNVLPTDYDKMILTVETANHTLTISRNATGKYEAGKLYKVVKNIPADKWVKKAAYTGGDLVFDFKTHPEGWPAETNDKAGDYDYVLSGVKYAFNLSTRVYCKGTSGDNGYLMISGKNGDALLGLPAISGFKLTKVVATINDQVSTVSSKTMVAITDGVDVIAGGAAQNWNTKGAVHTYTLTETEENTVYYMLATVANAQVMKLVLSYEPATPSATKYVVSFATVEGGSFSASPSKAEAGAEVTLTATPVEGYAFNNDWSVKGADETVIEVVDGKFVMPAQNVTVSGTFSKVIPLPTCATPVITIAENGVVSITCETAGATIHYSVGDSPADPTEADAVFSAVTLTEGQTIKAIAVAEGYKPSAVASKKYTVGGATGLVEYVSTFTDKRLNTKEKTVTWESSIDALGFESASPSRGVQFGTKKGKFTITGTGHTSNVKKISVIISTNYAGNTISATVGGVAIGSEISLTKKNNYEIVFESTTELSGDIVFNVNDKDKSVYIKSITVNPSN